MSNLQLSKTFTYLLSSGSIVFDDNNSYKKVAISIPVGASGNCTILGTGKVGAISSVAITLTAGESITVTNEIDPINDLTITVNSGCTARIIASQN